MKSKITIDVDYDNQPIIKVEYVASEDVRDKLVFKFINSFDAQTVWAKLEGIDYEIDWEAEKSLEEQTKNTFKLRPINNWHLYNEKEEMQKIINRYGLHPRNKVQPLDDIKK